MKEKIIVVPSSNKLLLSLAYQGESAFNTRVFTPIELAREVLLRSGKTCSKTFISRQEELSYYKNIIETVPYFKTSKLADIKSVNQTINTIRELVTAVEEKVIKENLSKGNFKEKNDALFKVYSLYINKLNDENKIDTIGLIRYAIENANKLESEFITLTEYELQPLALQLIKAVSNYKEEVSIFDLFKIKDKKICINSYKNCYGTSNEVETIINDIFKNKKADECVVACANYSDYSQTFYDISSKYDIALTFGEGLSLINSYPGKLLQQYYLWSTLGNFGWEPFNKLIYSPYFNYELLDSLIVTDNEKEFNRPKFYERLARLRLTNDVNINDQRIREFKNSIARSDINDNDKLEKYVAGFELIAKELSLPIEDFIAKYCVARNANEFVIKLDNSAKDALINELKTIKSIGIDITNDVIEALLRKPVLRQGNLPGHIHITSIKGALSCLRKNLYICGLSSSSYPGSPKENPLLLDCDLENFGNKKLTSEGRIKAKRESLLNLITLASSLSNEVNLSYPGLNVSELKNNNASSLMFEIYKTQNGDDKSLDDFKKSLINIGYFDACLSKTKQIGEAYVAAKEIVYKALHDENKEKTVLDIGSYSPSALNNFFNCKKQFFYQNLLKIAVEDDYNPYEVIPATEQGTLAHALMEYLGTHPMDKDSFIKLAGNAFDEYTKITVPLNSKKIDDVKDQFVEMLENGWIMNQKEPGKLLIAEEDNKTIHKETGITIHGFPDRVQKNMNGDVVVIDFKTERDKDSHKQDDIDSCLQVVIYAYIVESVFGIKVNKCEYRMLRFEDGIVTCKYDQEIKDALKDKLTEFKNSLESGDFSIEPFDKETEKQKCKFCKFGAICGKVVKDE